MYSIRTVDPILVTFHSYSDVAFENIRKSIEFKERQALMDSVELEIRHYPQLLLYNREYNVCGSEYWLTLGNPQKTEQRVVMATIEFGCKTDDPFRHYTIEINGKEYASNLIDARNAIIQHLVKG